LPSNSPNIYSRYEAFGTSIFTTMTQEANKHSAVNLAQGFPSFDGPSEIKDAAAKAMIEGKNQYAPSAGIPELRKRLAARYSNRLGVQLNWESQTTIFSGATEALWCSFQALYREHDEILVFEPFFDCYPAGAFAVGAKLVPIQLKAPDWTFHINEMRAKISTKTKAILLNTPHNPTGKVFTRKELEGIAEVAKEFNLIVISDDVYEELTFDEHVHIPIASLPGMFERTITISSFSKSFSFTGWKVGYVFASEILTQALRLVHQFTVFCSATPLQWGMIKALELGDEKNGAYYKNFRKDYDEKRKFLHKTLEESGFKVKLAEGSYFLIADYSELSDKNDLDFALWLTREIKVACLPLSVFCQNQKEYQRDYKLLRFAFCKDLPILQAAANHLKTSHSQRR